MPGETADLEIDGSLTIPRSEVSFATSRSSGPGGQNVNKVETRVTLLFDVDRSAVLDGEQRARLRERLATRLSKLGILRVTAQRERSQAANRRLVEERFVELLREALAEEEPRKPTTIPARARRRRLQEKRRLAEAKRLRRPPAIEE